MIHIVLYEPLIPQNTGNIMRTCVAANLRLHLIEPLGFSLDEKQLKRSGLDYIKDLDWELHSNWESFTAKYKGPYYFITRYSKKTYSEINFKQEEDIFLVFGKETSGIPKELLQDNLANCYRIPMVSTARSLNLANCVALVSYEALRQLDFPNLVKHEVIKGEDWLY